MKTLALTALKILCIAILFFVFCLVLTLFKVLGKNPDYLTRLVGEVGIGTFFVVALMVVGGGGLVVSLMKRHRNDRREETNYLEKQDEL